MDDATAGLRRLGSPFAHLVDGQWAVMQGDLFSDLGWEPYTRRWPRSGICAHGLCFARPTWEPRTDETGSSSSLLLTPTSNLAVNGGSQTMEKRRAGGHGPTLADQVETGIPVLPTPMAEEAHHTHRGSSQRRAEKRRAEGRQLTVQETVSLLLPTPRTTDRGSTEHPSPAELRGTHGRDLAPTVGMLLPSPRASDGLKGCPAQRGSSGDLMLPSVAVGLPVLPTPSAGVHNDGESLESWEARRAVLLAKGYNGNGQGTPLAIAVTAFLPTPAARERKGPGTGRPGRVRPDGRVRGAGDVTLGLAVAGMSLLPTPTVHDRQGPRTPEGVAARATTSGGPPRLLSETVANELRPGCPTAGSSATSRDAGTPRGGPAPGTRPAGGTTTTRKTPTTPLMPTPQAHDAHGAKTPEQQDAARAKGLAERGRNHGVANLNERVAGLLPTPTVMGGGQTSRSGDRKGEELLTGAARRAAEGPPSGTATSPTPTPRPGSTGSSTAPPSPSGKPSPDDEPLTLFSLPS
jgi:hypothetical protein